MRIHCLAVLLLLCAGACTLVGCVRPATPTAAPPPQPAAPTALNVFAASSLTEPLEQFDQLFQQSHPGLNVRLNLAGTQELKIQLEQGAQCDVFISASTKQMNDLVTDKLVLAQQELARNGLCVVTEPHSNTVTRLEDLAKKRVRLVVAVTGSPIGKYTRECWEKMIKDPQFGVRFVAAMEDNVVSEETNVKLVLSKVLLGEADAGFVYVSDAQGKKVDVIDLPAHVQVMAKYSVGRCAGSASAALADEYVQGLLSPEGQDILRKAGLQPAVSPGGASQPDSHRPNPTP